jgi:hypothetical protein
MAKKVKGKQKQEEQVAAGQIVPNADSTRPVNVPAMATGTYSLPYQFFNNVSCSSM